MARQLWYLVCLSLLVALAAGCTPAQYAKRADITAYATLAGGQRVALGDEVPFSIDYRPLGRDDDGNWVSITLGERTIQLRGDETGIITLADALEIAFYNSREFQDRREDLFASALLLANERRGWDLPLFDGFLDADAQWERIAKAAEAKSASASLTPSLVQRFVNGGVLTLAATIDWATDFMGSTGNIVTSLLEVNFTQPLLRGAWRDFAYEDQYRLERDFLFDVYGFYRFRQDFAAGIFNDYYNVLQLRNRIENAERNIERKRETLALAKVRVAGGQQSATTQDEAEQDLFKAETELQVDLQAYQNRLDRFKITLGLPVLANLKLDFPNALVELRDAGPLPLPIEEDDAIDVALSSRPDVLIERAKVRDADRDVEIAVDQFNPQLNVIVGVDARSKEPRNFWEVEFDKHRRFASVQFNWELDQTNNRDAYRLSMIAFERSLRDLQQFEDGVRLEVRDSYRNLLRTKRNYESWTKNLKIAERRRMLAALQQKEGQVTTRDVLRAEEDLLQAENSVSRTLIEYATTRMQFLSSLGLLRTDQRGLMQERKEPFRFDLLSEQYDYVAN